MQVIVIPGSVCVYLTNALVPLENQVIPWFFLPHPRLISFTESFAACVCTDHTHGDGGTYLTKEKTNEQHGLVDSYTSIPSGYFTRT